VRRAVADSGALRAARAAVNEQVDRALNFLGAAELRDREAGALLAELAERIRP